MTGAKPIVKNELQQRAVSSRGLAALRVCLCGGSRCQRNPLKNSCRPTLCELCGLRIFSHGVTFPSTRYGDGAHAVAVARACAVAKKDPGCSGASPKLRTSGGRSILGIA
jgi:hypothetical protein